MPLEVNDVLITGYGVFSAFGFGAEAQLDGVFGGEHAFTPVSRFDASPYRAGWAATYPGDPAGPPPSTEWKIEPGSTPTQRQIVIACARAATAMAGLEAGAPEPVPVLLGSSGDLNQSGAFWRGLDEVPVADSLAGELAVAVAEALGLPGEGAPRTAFINACVASTNAVISAAQLIRTGRAEVVVCGGVYVVGEMTFSMFDSGRALSSQERIRPFSRDRSGLLLGDGAAMFVLESARHARARGAEPLARLSGWGMAADAHHVVQPHPDGAGLALAANRALAGAGIGSGAIDYVNAHGTGTPLNDKAETRALHRVFGAAAGRLPVSSTKSATGHMLEATGAVELAITLLALLNGRIPPTGGYREPDPDCDLDYVPGESRAANLRRALTLNAAFGGVNAAVVVERV